jgi:hypothetical protein
VNELELGSGTIESDRAFLKEKLPFNASNCVTYRLSQKEMAHGYLQQAQALLACCK